MQGKRAGSDLTNESKRSRVSSGGRVEPNRGEGSSSSGPLSSGIGSSEEPRIYDEEEVERIRELRKQQAKRDAFSYFDQEPGGEFETIRSDLY